MGVSKKTELLFDTIDTLASEYGWTIEYISQLEMAEIAELMESIRKRKIGEWKIMAYLQRCAYVGKLPNFGEADLESEENSIPEDIQLLKLMKEIGGEVRKV